MVEVKNLVKLNWGIRSGYIKYPCAADVSWPWGGPAAQILGTMKLRWYMLPDLHLILLLIISWQSSTSGFLWKMGNELDSKSQMTAPSAMVLPGSHNLLWVSILGVKGAAVVHSLTCFLKNPSSFWSVVKVSLHLITPVSSSMSYRENNDMKSYTGANKLKRWPLTTPSCSASVAVHSRTFRNTNTQKKGIKDSLCFYLSKTEQRHFDVICMYTIFLHPLASLSRWWTIFASDLFCTEHTTCFQIGMKRHQEGWSSLKGNSYETHIACGLVHTFI